MTCSLSFRLTSAPVSDSSHNYSSGSSPAIEGSPQVLTKSSSEYKLSTEPKAELTQFQVKVQFNNHTVATNLYNPVPNQEIVINNKIRKNQCERSCNRSQEYLAPETSTSLSTFPSLHHKKPTNLVFDSLVPVRLEEPSLAPQIKAETCKKSCKNIYQRTLLVLVSTLLTNFKSYLNCNGNILIKGSATDKVPAPKLHRDNNTLDHYTIHNTRQRPHQTTPHLSHTSPADNYGYRYLHYLQFPLTIEKITILVPKPTLLLSLGSKSNSLKQESSRS